MRKKGLFLLLLPIFILFFGCATKNFKVQGNGAGYGGGDNALTYARQLFVRALIQVRDDVALDQIGNADACSSQIRSPALCNLLLGLAPVQKEYLLRFLKKYAKDLLDMNIGASRVRFEFTQQALNLSSTGGESRDLSAKTQLGRFGNIVFNSDSVQVLNDWERLQLITHELGHKLERIDGQHNLLDDDSVLGPFSSGKLFLDTLGSALAGYLASSVGRAIISFPADKGCDSNTTGLILSSAPYFSKTGQEAVGLLDRLKSTSDSGADFTLTAWVRVFDDLQQSDSQYRGQVIFSNKDFKNGIVPGLQIVRLNNGNFGAYGGTERIIDSGLKIVPGGFHLVSLKRTQNKFFLSVDGITGNSDTAQFFSSYDAKNILSGLVEMGTFAQAKAMLGAPGNNPTPPLGGGFIDSNGYQFHQLDFWQGNIASLSFYNSALTENEIGSLYQCSPLAYRVSTPKSVGPGYPIPTPQTDGKIESMITNNDILYLGGGFEHFGDKQRFHITAVDTKNNNALLPFAPVVYGMSVKAMAIAKNTLFVGGNFLRVNGVERNYLAAIDLTTGALLNWNPKPDYEVTSLAISNNFLFVGGSFSNLGNTETKYLASFDITDLTNIQRRNNWNVVLDGGLRTLLVSGNLLYLGGCFSDVGGAHRRRLAAVDVNTGTLAEWNPGASGGEVLVLAKAGNTIYAGGEFTEVGPSENPIQRNYLAAIHAETGAILDWNPSPDYSVYSLVPFSNSVFIGGAFSQIGATPRSRTAEVAMDTGLLSNWNPNLDGSVYAILPNATRVILGGDFQMVNNQISKYFAVTSK